MPFEQGISGNPGGRPKGAKNKHNTYLRETISDFLENNFSRIITDFELLNPKDRVRFYCDLLQYGLPRLQNVQLETEFDTLTDTQLDKIIDELKNSTNFPENG